MEKVIEIFDILNVKAQKLEEAMIVLPHKPNLMEKLSELGETSKEIKDLEAKIKASLKDHENLLKKEYASTTKTINRCQMKMMYLLHHLDGLEDKNKNPRALDFHTPSTSSMADLDGARALPSGSYQKPIHVNVPVFKAVVSDEAFAKVPSYMKGRSSILDLQTFLEHVIRTFEDKYSTLHKQRSKMSSTELNNYKMFKEQANLFEGEKFITADDIARVIGKNVDKKADRNIQMLRHVHILREARKGAICCYIWLNNC